MAIKKSINQYVTPLKLATVLLGASAIFGNSSSFASYGECCTPYWDEVTPYIGVDYYHVWMGAKGDWLKVLNKTYPGGAVYVGAKFCDGFGVEFGGIWSAREAKTTTISSFFGNPAIPPMTVDATVRRSGGYADFIGYVPMGNCLEVTGHLGYGVIHPKVTFATNRIINTPMSSALITTRGKSRGIFRLGLGASYMVTELMGIRAKLGWEGTSQLRLDGNQSFYNLGMSPKGFKGTTTLQAGVFIKF